MINNSIASPLININWCVSLLGLVAFLMSYYKAPNIDFIFVFLSCLILLVLFIKTFYSTPILEVFNDKLGKFMAFFGMVLFVSYLTSNIKDQSAIAFWPYLCGITAFFLWRAFNKNYAWKTLWLQMTLFALIICCYSIRDFINGSMHINAHIYDPNVYSEILLCVITPLSMIYLRGNNTKLTNRIIEFIILILTFNLVLTDSRAGILIWVGSFILLVSYLLLKKQFIFSNAIKIISIFICAWLLYFFFDVGSYSMADLNAGNASPLGVRLLMWQSSWDIFLENPFTGTGLKTFPYYYYEYRSPLDIYTSGANPHNDYLQFLVEGGALLFLCLISLCLTNAFFAFQRLFGKNLVISSANQEPDNAVRFSLHVVIIGFTLHAMINFIFITGYLFYITCLYLSIATTTTHLQPTIIDSSNKNLTKNRYRIISITLVSMLTFTYLATDYLLDNLFNTSSLTHKKMLLVEADNHSTLFKAANLLTVLRPNDSGARTYIIRQGIESYKNSTTIQRKRDIGNFLNLHFEKYLSGCRQCAYAHVERADFYLLTGEHDLAELDFEREIEMEPTGITTYFKYADHLANTDRYPEAMTLLLNIPEVWVNLASDFNMKNYNIVILEVALEIAQTHRNTVDQSEISKQLILIDPQNELANKHIIGKS